MLARAHAPVFVPFASVVMMSKQQDGVMPAANLQMLAGTDVAALMLGLIALMQVVVWMRAREPGFPWLIAAFVLNAGLAAFNDALLPGSTAPDTAYLLGNYVAHGCYALGLVSYLRIGGRTRPALLVVLTLPMALAGCAIIVTPDSLRTVALWPLILVGAGYFVLCAVAARREPGSGLAFLAIGSLIGPLYLLRTSSLGIDPFHARYYIWPAALNFGIVLPVVSLLRHWRTIRDTQARAVRLASFYEALSRTNQAIVRVRDAPALYDTICRICVDAGQASMAYIGVPEDGRLRPVASAGPADALLTGLRIDLDASSQFALGPASTALREGRHQICNDFLNDERTSPWQEHGRRSGVRAQASFPFRRGGRLEGVLTLYMGQAGFFDQQIVQLLDEITHDLSFALDNIDLAAAREAAERDARAGLERFSRIFHALPLPAAVSRLGDGGMLAVNDTFCALLGLPRQSILGHGLSEFGVGMSAAERAEVTGLVRRQGGMRNREVTVRLNSGASHELLMSAEAIEYSGEPCMLTISNDVTVLKRTERELRRSLERFELAASTGNIWFWDPDHGLTEVGGPLRTVLGYPRDADAKRLDWGTLVHPDDRDALRQAIVAHLKHREPYSAEFRARSVDGSYRWLQARGQAVWNEHGRATHMAGTAFDVTAHRAAEESQRARIAAEAASEAKTDFLSHVSHELRTPC